MTSSDLSRKSSLASVRRYVDEQLETVANEWPHLSVRSHEDGAGDPPVTSDLWWTIHASRMDRSGHLLHRHYVVEAHVDRGEFVIWFGALEGFKWTDGDPRPRMFPAVHVAFPGEQYVVDDALALRDLGPREPCQLSDVLRFMLNHRYDPHADWDPMAYPMNGGRY